MSDSAPVADQYQATVAARLEQLTSLYERNAYVVHNLTSRICVTPERAARATERAFLAQVSQPDPARLTLDAARLAVEEADQSDRSTGDDPVLGANARLTPPERAALALTMLAGAGGAQVAASLGIDAPAAAQLETRAAENLGVLLRATPDEALERYRALELAEPPIEIWNALYPELHANVAQTARAEAQERAQPAARRRPRPRLGVVRRVPRWGIVAAVLLVAAGGAMAARGGGGGGDDDDAGPLGSSYQGAAGLPVPPSDSGGGFGYESLSPRELDKLRQDELEDLRRYERRQADRKLSPTARRRAARRAQGLTKEARRRLRAAARREEVARRELARERAARAHDRARRRQEKAESQRDPDPQPSPPRDDETPREEPPPSDPSDEPDYTECLYDAESGTYVCPE
jgi:hypothetical protein